MEPRNKRFKRTKYFLDERRHGGWRRRRNEKGSAAEAGESPYARAGTEDPEDRRTGRRTAGFDFGEERHSTAHPETDAISDVYPEGESNARGKSDAQTDA